jgi:predicted RecA/RadA family phage recombinase
MKNFIGVGNRVTLVAAAITASGQAVLLGSLFGIAETAAAIGDPLVLMLNGIYDLPKTASQAWTVGQLIYWDVATSRVTNVVATNKLVGVAVLAVGAGAGETTGRVRLTAASAN